MAVRATNLANEFAAYGYFCDILATGEVGDTPFTALKDNVAVVDIAEYSKKHSKDSAVVSDQKKRRSRIKRLKRLRCVTKLLAKADRSLECRIKHLRSGESLRAYFLHETPFAAITFGASYIASTIGAADGLDCKVIYAEKNAPQVELAYSLENAGLFFRLLHMVSAVIVQTADAAFFYHSHGFSNVIVINDPVKPNLPPTNEGTRRKAVVNFCRMSEQKNIGLLIDAFALFRETHPDYTLEIYGNTVSPAEEEYRDKMISKAEDMGLSDSVKILPPAADVHEKVRDAAMFVSSSDFEGLSNSMIEAMAIGLPCVCTDCLGGGTREVMTDGENGLIVPMKDTLALANAMSRLADDPDFAEKCSANAAKIKEKLSVKTIAEQWLEIIENL